MHRWILLLSTVVALVALGLCSCGDHRPPTGAHSPLAFTLTANDGRAVPLATYAGKVVLLVNTASHCVYTKQYKGLEALYVHYQDQGLVVIGIPSDDFFGQEPGTNEEIHTFCTATYGITFPLMAKVDVTRDGQVALYQYLTKESPFPGKITWNFNKFLIGRNGQVVARFGSHITPDDAQVIAAVQTALAVPLASAVPAPGK